MLDEKIINEIENTINYKFNDKSLLVRCFTHSSYSNEHGGENNERLEFLGDAILQFVVSVVLYEKGGDEGVMTKCRQNIVSAIPLENAIKKMKLQKYIISSGKNKNNLGKKSISNLFEALTAGIYIDGGLEKARNFILDSLVDANPLQEVNYKGKLQEFTQNKLHSQPQYNLIKKCGPEHNPVFTVEVSVNGTVATGEGKSLRNAEQSAAEQILIKLGGNRG